MKIIILITFFLLCILITIKANCDGCKNNALTPCVEYIAEGIERYCKKSGDTSRCFCDWR